MEKDMTFVRDPCVRDIVLTTIRYDAGLDHSYRTACGRYLQLERPDNWLYCAN